MSSDCRSSVIRSTGIGVAMFGDARACAVARAGLAAGAARRATSALIRPELPQALQRFRTAPGV
jgi:hypothetical protein